MSDSLVAGSLVDGRYLLDQRLGVGSFGDVWRARDARLSNRAVAVKFLRPEHLERADLIARFDAEADALALMQHPNVVSVTDRGEWHGLRYLVTEFVEGISLAEWLKRHRVAGTMTDVPTVLALFDQVCSALAAAHAIREPGPIVHRDLKPENVLLRELAGGELVVKVLDFGVAQLGGRTGTNTGMLLGTPMYMAPEQAMGRSANIGPWTDVFALGVLLIEMLTLRARIGEDETWWGMVMLDAGKVRELLGGLRVDVPPAVWDVLARALQPRGADRHPDADALRRAMRSTWDAGSTTQPPLTPPGGVDLRPSGAGVVAAPIAPTAPIGSVATRPAGPRAAPGAPAREAPRARPAPRSRVGALFATALAAIVLAVVAVVAARSAGVGGLGARADADAGEAPRAGLDVDVDAAAATAPPVPPVVRDAGAPPAPTRVVASAPDVSVAALDAAVAVAVVPLDAGAPALAALDAAGAPEAAVAVESATDPDAGAPQELVVPASGATDPMPLDAIAPVAQFVRRWARAVSVGRGRAPFEAFYTAHPRFRRTGRGATAATIRNYWRHHFAQRGTFGVDARRSTVQLEAVGAEPGAVGVCGDAALPGADGPVIKVRAWATEVLPGRNLEIGCSRLEGVYLLRLRRVANRLRICYETWSTREGLCASCPRAPACRNLDDNN